MKILKRIIYWREYRALKRYLKAHENAMRGLQEISENMLADSLLSSIAAEKDRENKEKQILCEVKNILEGGE